MTVNLANAGNQVVNANLTLNLGSATTMENVIGGTLNDILIGNILINRMTSLQA